MTHKNDAFGPVFLRVNSNLSLNDNDENYLTDHIIDMVHFVSNNFQIQVSSRLRTSDRESWSQILMKYIRSTLIQFTVLHGPY